MKIANGIKWIEIYNARKFHKLEVNVPKWDSIPKTTSGKNTEAF
jgi:hypothetical protein